MVDVGFAAHYSLSRYLTLFILPLTVYMKFHIPLHFKNLPFIKPYNVF